MRFEDWRVCVLEVLDCNRKRWSFWLVRAEAVQALVGGVWRGLLRLSTQFLVRPQARGAVLSVPWPKKNPSFMTLR